MKFFLIDLWNDLREKRLWPVALALLAGLIAVPVALTKGSEEPAATAPVATDARTAPEPKELKGLARVKLESSAVNSGSRLDTFDPSNPFRPPSKVLEAAQEGSQASATQAGPGPDSGSSGSGGSTDSSGSAGGSAGDTGSIVTPAPYTGGTSGGGGDTRSRPRTSQYTFVVDATFIANGRKRRVKRMERLDMLPHRASPLLLFLGVSANAGRAVFLVDSTLQAAGEGICKPGGDRCAFLYIGPGSEHEFVNDHGDSFTLRIKEIRKVKVQRSAGASKKKKKKAKGATGSASSHRRFVPPVLADLVTVSGARERRANNRGRRR
jgi:hypothetical protein